MKLSAKLTKLIELAQEYGVEIRDFKLTSSQADELRSEFSTDWAKAASSLLTRTPMPKYGNIGVFMWSGLYVEPPLPRIISDLEKALAELKEAIK